LVDVAQRRFDDSALVGSQRRLRRHGSPTS
jgi:hypothetical protein